MSHSTTKPQWVNFYCLISSSHYLSQCYLLSVRSIDIHLRAISQEITELFHSNIHGANELTLNVRGPSYLGLTRSISWLLMSWLLTSPGHQQPWYWLCRISLVWGRISTTCVLSMWKNDTKCKYMFMSPHKNLARKGLNSWRPNDVIWCQRTWPTLVLATFSVSNSHHLTQSWVSIY